MNKICTSCGPYWERCKGAVWIFLFIVLIIVLYWIFLIWYDGHANVVHNDVLNVSVIEVEGIRPLSWWPISHFILFFILGILFPTCDVLIIGAGILWEIVEVALLYILEKKTRQPVRINNRIEYNGNFWQGSLRDIFLNILGFYTGKLLRYLYIKYSHRRPLESP